MDIMSGWEDYSDHYYDTSLREQLVLIGESIWYSTDTSYGGVVEYSIKTNKTVSRTEYPTNIKRPVNHSCCKYKNNIIIVNGDKGEIIEFNPSTKQFTKKADMPKIGWKACCINMDNDIHIFHGINNCKHLIYSPKMNKIKILNDETTRKKIEQVCVLKYGDKIIRFGGFYMDEMKSLDSLFISSPIALTEMDKTIKWQLKCKLTKGLFGCGYILYNNTYIITFGGSHSWAQYIDTIFVANMKENGKWFELKNIKCPLPSSYLAILDLQNNIHLFTQDNKHGVKKHFVCKISSILKHIYDAVRVFDDEIRVSWEIGSDCSIYSRSTNQWYVGKVDKIYGSEKDEWLIVKYNVNNKNKKKEIQRHCKDIKPFIPLLKYIENKKQKTICEYRKLTVYGYVRNIEINKIIPSIIIDIICKFYLIGKQTLWCIGLNYYGQLGLGHHNKPYKIKELTKCEWSVHNAITDIIPSYNRNIFQINNTYYASPALKFGKDCYTPKTITYFADNNITDVIKCVGFPNIFDKFICVWITKSNDLYILVKEKWQKITYFKDNNLKIKQVAWDGSFCGLLVLCENGLVYYCGNTLEEWWKIMENIKVIKMQSIAMSSIHTIFVSEMGSVWICSYNERGYLGLEHKYVNDRYPEKIRYFRKNKIKIIAVACGISHTLLLDNKNIVYAFGFNEGGECGNGTMETVSKPQIIFKNASEISCGWGHSLIKSMDGKYYFFGRNDNGECLSENEKNVLTPKCMDYQIYSKIRKKDTILSVKLGGGNTFILTHKS